MTWDLGQGRQWQYLNELDLRPRDDAPHGWLVHWSPSVVHPQLAAGQRLALRTEDAQPAPVVDRGGAALLAATPVVTVLLDRRAAGNLATVAGALATALGPIDPEITQASITDGATKTPDGQGYTVAVLRQADYLRVKNAIHDLPGVRFTSAQRLLAPGRRVREPGAARRPPRGRAAAGRHAGLVGARRRRHGQPDHDARRDAAARGHDRRHRPRPGHPDRRRGRRRAGAAADRAGGRRALDR